MLGVEDVFAWTFYVIMSFTGFFVAVWLIGLKKCLNPRLFAGLFLFFMAMTYLIRPPLSYLVGEGYAYAESFSIPMENLPWVGVFVAISFVSFAVGYRVHSPDSFHGASGWRWQREKRVEICAKTLIAIGYFGLIYSGGVGVGGNQELDAMAGGTINLSGTSFIGLSALLVPAGTILLYASSGRWLLPALLGFPYVAVSIISAYNRYTYITFAVSLGLIVLIRRPRFSVRVYLGLIALGTVALGFFLLIGANRIEFHETKDLKANVVDLKAGGIDRFLGDFAGFEGTIYTVNRMDSEYINFGARNFYAIFILPIPRFIWPGKPLPPEFTWWYAVTGERREGFRTTEFDLFNNSQVKGHVGYALEDWSWAGPFITFFFTGLLYGWVEKKFWSSNGNSCGLAGYVTLYSLLLYSGRNMVTDNLVRYVIYFFVPYFLIWRFAGRRTSSVRVVHRRLPPGSPRVFRAASAPLNQTHR